MMNMLWAKITTEFQSLLDRDRRKVLVAEGCNTLVVYSWRKKGSCRFLGSDGILGKLDWC